jgi:hypothetical protein
MALVLAAKAYAVVVLYCDYDCKFGLSPFISHLLHLYEITNPQNEHFTPSFFCKEGRKNTTLIFRSICLGLFHKTIHSSLTGSFGQVWANKRVNKTPNKDL